VFNVTVDFLIGSDSAFIHQAGEQYGYAGKKQAKDILNDINALFAGGELPEEDRDEFFRMVTEMYFDAKKNNKKYGRKKHKQ